METALRNELETKIEELKPPDQLKLTYNLIDYNEEWREAIWQLLSGEFDAEEYTAKFNPQPVVFEIKL